MAEYVAWFFSLLSMFNISFGCFNCFIEPDDRVRLCRGYTVSNNNIRNIDACFKTLDRIFHNPNINVATKVGREHEAVLKELLMAEIMPILKEFDQETNTDVAYEERLQAAADTFFALASGLPRAFGCIPPCGFQELGMVYNCLTCQYDTCEFPLDCPSKEIIVEESNRTQMWCKVPFVLPMDILIVWRYAKIKTVLVDQFKEVTAGEDELYSIPSARLEHSGTYQCEIFSQEHSIVRIYYHLKVVHHIVVGHAELQNVFDQALLPAGQFPLLTPQPPFILLRRPSPELITTCLTSLLLLLFLTLGLVYRWSFIKKDANLEKEPDRNKYVLQME